MHRYLLMVLAPVCIVPPAAGVPAETDPIRKLIAELGADKFRAREKASAELLKLGERALPEIIKASKSPNAEIAMHAEKLVVRIRLQLQDKETAYLLSEIGSEGMEHFVKKLTSDNELNSATKWNAIAKLTQRVQELGEKQSAVKFKKTPGNVEGEIVRHWTPSKGGLRLVPEGPLRLTGISDSTVVSSGPFVQTTNSFDSIIIVAGDLQSNSIWRSIVICSGGVKSTHFENCIILAKGVVRTTSAKNSFIQAGEGASCNIGTDCVLFNTAKSLGFSENRNKFISLKDDAFAALQFKDATPSTIPDLIPER